MVGRAEVVIGVISDTHGLLRPEALGALKGSDFIVHAGDVGSLEILGRLGRIAPVTAVRGNVDTDSWAASMLAAWRRCSATTSSASLRDRPGRRASTRRMSRSVISQSEPSWYASITPGCT